MQTHQQLVRAILAHEKPCGFQALVREDELESLSTEELEAIIQSYEEVSN